jgi:lysophospholipid acyltransferase (LPLAT)-like uncharacterized protein
MTSWGERLLDRGLRALASGWRFDIVGQEHLAGIHPDGQPAIWVVWHGQLLPLLWLHRHQGTTLLVSRHRDGERFARVASRLGYRTLRGSSTRGGAAALRGLIRSLEGGAQVAIAADGPRGPRERVKPGAVAAALRTGAPLIPVAVSARPAWQLRTWDGFLLPAPWARVRVAYGAPLRLAPRDHGDRPQAARRLQERLDQVSWLAAN